MKITGPVFRRADPAETRKIVALFNKAKRALRRHGIDQWDKYYPNRRILSEDIAKRELFVLILGGKIVSAVVLNEYQPDGYDGADWSDRCGRAAVVHRLCVHPRFQGKGIGRATLRGSEEFLKNEGYSSIRLDAFKANIPALRLYVGMEYCLRGIAVFRKGEFALFERQLLER